MFSTRTISGKLLSRQTNKMVQWRKMIRELNEHLLEKKKQKKRARVFAEMIMKGSIISHKNFFEYCLSFILYSSLLWNKAPNVFLKRKKALMFPSRKQCSSMFSRHAFSIWYCMVWQTYWLDMSDECVHAKSSRLIVTYIYQNFISYMQTYIIIQYVAQLRVRPPASTRYSRGRASRSEYSLWLATRAYSYFFSFVCTHFSHCAASQKIRIFHRLFVQI